MRKKRLLYNTFAAIAKELVNLVCGLILPRLIIAHYGSATNGLLASITQFLAFFSMMEMGVGAVVRAALYKPLADRDSDGISRILISSRRFFNRIGGMLCLYTLALMVYFPLAVDHSLGAWSTALLVGAVAFSSIANYMFGIVYAQLLNADQKSYIQLGSATLTTVLNTGFSVVLIYLDASIVTVKLVAAVVLLVRPLLLRLYVGRHYSLNFRLTLTEEPLKQKWNGLAQHIATYVLKHADTVILTLFSTLENVSIYYVHHLVTNGLQQLVEIMTTGIGALLGDMYAKDEREKLQNTFAAFEWLMHTFVTLIYTMAGLLIVPFVRVYTQDIADVSYIVPVFAALIVLANGAYCLRLPYNIMVNAAGHFKQTQSSAIIEACMNVVISVLLVSRYGLVGVAIGTFVAMGYRTTYLAWYLRRNILHRSFTHYLRHLALDALTLVLIVGGTHWIGMQTVSWLGWLLCAICTGCIAVAITALLNVIFYRRLIGASLNLLLRKKNGRKG